MYIIKIYVNSGTLPNKFYGTGIILSNCQLFLPLFLFFSPPSFPLLVL